MTLTDLKDICASHIRHMWAGSTWSNYGNIWARYLEFTMTHDLTIESDTNAAIFVVSTQTSLQAQHQYSKNLHALFKRFGWETKTLSLMAAGMRHQGALIPLKQATPITFEAVMALKNLPGSPWLGIMIAWSTASRWDDVVNLTKQMFLESTEVRSVISWVDQTKTTKDDPFRASAYTVVVGQLAKEIHQMVSQLPPQAHVTTMSTTLLDRWFAAMKPPLPWTGHSFKRGAATRLVELAAAGTFDMKYLPLLLKHKTASDFSATSIRYGNRSYCLTA